MRVTKFLGQQRITAQDRLHPKVLVDRLIADTMAELVKSQPHWQRYILKRGLKKEPMYQSLFRQVTNWPTVSGPLKRGAPTPGYEDSPRRSERLSGKKRQQVSPKFGPPSDQSEEEKHSESDVEVTGW